MSDCPSCGEDLDDYSSIQCSDCAEDGCGACFCSDCDRCDDCCLCKCSVCGDKDWQMTDTNEGNVCRGCYAYCFKCSSRQHPKGMAAHEICNSCAENMARCEACGDYLDEYDTVSCVECRVPYCNWCSDEPENMTRTEDDEPICRDCAPVKSAETFEADPEYHRLNYHGDLPYDVMKQAYNEARNRKPIYIDGRGKSDSFKKDWEYLELDDDTIDHGFVTVFYQHPSDSQIIYYLEFNFDVSDVIPHDEGLWTYNNFDWDPVNPKGYADYTVDGKRTLSTHKLTGMRAETFEADKEYLSRKEDVAGLDDYERYQLYDDGRMTCDECGADDKTVGFVEEGYKLCGRCDREWMAKQGYEAETFGADYIVDKYKHGIEVREFPKSSSVYQKGMLVKQYRGDGHRIRARSKAQQLEHNYKPKSFFSESNGKVNLTIKEMELLRAIDNNHKGNHWGVDEDEMQAFIYHDEWNMTVYRGVMSSLAKKGIIEIGEPEKGGRQVVSNWVVVNPKYTVGQDFDMEIDWNIFECKELMKEFGVEPEQIFQILDRVNPQAFSQQMGAETFGAESGQMCEVCFGNDDMPYDSDHFTECRRCGKSVCIDCEGEMEHHPEWSKVCAECSNVLDNVHDYGAETFNAEEEMCQMCGEKADGMIDEKFAICHDCDTSFGSFERSKGFKKFGAEIKYDGAKRYLRGLSGRFEGANNEGFFPAEEEDFEDMVVDEISEHTELEAETFESQNSNMKLALGLTGLGIGLALWKGKELLSLWDRIKEKME